MVPSLARTGRHQGEGVGVNTTVQLGRMGGCESSVGPAESTAEAPEGGVEEGEREAPPSAHK